MKSYFNCIPIFEPLNPFLFIIDLTNISLVILNFLLIPFEICFANKIEGELSLIYFVRNLNYLLILEIIFKLRTCYYENGRLISSPKKITKHYFTSLAVPDIIALCFLLFSTTSCLKLVFFWKIYDLVKIQEKYEDLLTFKEIPLKIYKIIFFLVNSFLIFHFFSCFWFKIGTSEENAQTWLTKAQIEVTMSDSFELYLISLYWIISFLSYKADYNNINASNNNEYIFCIFLHFFAFFFLLYVFIQIKNTFFLETNNDSSKSLKKIGGFQNSSLINYNAVKFSRYMDQKYVDNENLKNINTKLKSKLISEDFLRILNKNKFFKRNFRQEFLEKLAENVSIVQFIPEEQIFKVKNKTLLFFCKFYRKVKAMRNICTL